MTIASCLYVGKVEHRRFSPVKHSFRYKVLYYFLDLEEIPSIFRFPFVFSYNFPGILSFWRKNYLGDSSTSLKLCIEEYIKSNTGTDFSGRVRLLTNISYFGFCINPVSFYYCYESDGVTLKYIISEITNTPWCERHRQLFTFESTNKNIYQFPKDFHVSPFMPITMDYTWIFDRPEQDLFILMQNRNQGEEKLFFDATLKLKRQSLTALNVLKYFAQFPFVTLKTLTAIYFQAARLYLKRVPFYNHPKKENNYDHSSAS